MTRFPEFAIELQKYVAQEQARRQAHHSEDNQQHMQCGIQII